jgi:hypothetical protein
MPVFILCLLVHLNFFFLLFFSVTAIVSRVVCLLISLFFFGCMLSSYNGYFCFLFSLNCT